MDRISVCTIGREFYCRDSYVLDGVIYKHKNYVVEVSRGGLETFMHPFDRIDSLKGTFWKLPSLEWYNAIFHFLYTNRNRMSIGVEQKRMITQLKDSFKNTEFEGNSSRCTTSDFVYVCPHGEGVMLQDYRTEHTNAKDFIVSSGMIDKNVPEGTLETLMGTLNKKQVVDAWKWVVGNEPVIHVNLPVGRSGIYPITLGRRDGIPYSGIFIDNSHNYTQAARGISYKLKE